MSGNKKYYQAGPDWKDVGTAIDALRTDCSCETRITIRQSKNDSSCFHVVVEAYTDYGTPLGVARATRIWSAYGGQSLPGAVLLAMHHVYQEAYDKAHMAPHPLGRSPKGK